MLWVWGDSGPGYDHNCRSESRALRHCKGFVSRSTLGACCGVLGVRGSIRQLLTVALTTFVRW